MLSRRTLLTSAAAAAASGCVTNPKVSPIDSTVSLPFSQVSLGSVLERLDSLESLQTGTPDELTFGEFVQNSLEKFGYEVIRQPISAPGFDVRRAVAICGDSLTEVWPQPIVIPTGPKGIHAPIHLWRDSSDTEHINGAIALVMLPYGRHSRLESVEIKTCVDEAVRGGANALILVTEGPTGETIRLNANYTTPPAPVPVVLVGPKHAEHLIHAAMTGAECQLIVDGTSLRRESANILGQLDRDGSAGHSTLVVSTPRTGWTRCVGERGPGLAVFLALAEWAPDALPTSKLLFVSTAAHEYDNAGGLQFMSDLAPPPEDVKLWVHLGSGFGARNYHEVGRYALRALSSAFPQRFLVGSDELVPALKNAFAGLPGLEDVYPGSAGAAGELREILSHGFGPTFGLFGGHYFHHIDEDRLDKVDPKFVHQAGTRIRDIVEKVLVGKI